MRTCAGCGATVQDERFCPTCGAAIPQFHDPASQSVTPPPAPAPRPEPLEQAPFQKADPEPAGPACQICGARPAVVVSFKQVVGKILAWQQAELRAPYCRDCGRAVGRDMQNRTLMTGWWGIIAPLANLLVIPSNAISLHRVGRLSAPRPANGTVRYNTAGRSIFARSGVWVAGALFALIVGVVAVISSSSSEGDSGGGGGGSNNVDVSEFGVFEEGGCVDVIGSQVAPVSCSSAGVDGQVIAEVLSTRDCPLQTDSYVKDLGLVYCIDES